MKISIKFLAIALAVIGITSSAHAQVTATASTTATFVTPLSIAQASNMNFGLLASSSAGTAVISTASVASHTGGVTFPAGGDPKTAASFTVTGEGTSTYSILTPASVTLTGLLGGTLLVDQIVTSPTPGGALTAGTQTVLVGATLNIPVGTVADVYSNASSLYVTVNYN